MGAPLTAGLPLGLELGLGYTIRFAAVDPVTGNAVTGVKVSGCSILSADTAGDTPELVATSPLWVPVPTVFA